MQKFQSLEDAVHLAEFAHRHQRDKAGLSYIEHPKRVLAAVQAAGARPYVQIAAILHDVVEDTPITETMLLELGFSEAAVQLVSLVTRRKAEPDNVEAELERYYSGIRDNADALLIKLCDINDNLQAWRLSYLPDKTQKRLQEKYAKAKRMLGVTE